MSSLLPAGGVGHRIGYKLSSEVGSTLHQCYVSVVCTSGLLYFFGAELGCGGGRRMMGGGVILEQEVAPSEDGANTLLRRFAHLEWRITK